MKRTNENMSNCCWRVLSKGLWSPLTIAQKTWSLGKGWKLLTWKQFNVRDKSHLEVLHGTDITVNSHCSLRPQSEFFWGDHSWVMRLPKWRSSSSQLSVLEEEVRWWLEDAVRKKEWRVQWHHDDGNHAAISCCLGTDWSLNDYLRHTVPPWHLSKESRSCQPCHGPLR